VTLLEAKRDCPIRILEIPDDRARAQCIRFGIGEGSVVESAETLPLGPVLVRHCNQEICLGRNLAARIRIEPQGRCGCPSGKGRRRRLAACVWGERQSVASESR